MFPALVAQVKNCFFLLKYITSSTPTDALPKIKKDLGLAGWNAIEKSESKGLNRFYYIFCIGSPFYNTISKSDYTLSITGGQLPRKGRKGSNHSLIYGIIVPFAGRLSKLTKKPHSA
jgi:hypothetical protein